MDGKKSIRHVLVRMSFAPLGWKNWHLKGGDITISLKKVENLLSRAKNLYSHLQKNASAGSKCTRTFNAQKMKQKLWNESSAKNSHHIENLQTKQSVGNQRAYFKSGLFLSPKITTFGQQTINSERGSEAYLTIKTGLRNRTFAL